MITLTAEAALEIIAGDRMCIDNLMSDKDIAREALATIRAARAQEQAEQEPVSDYFDFGLEEVEDYLRNCCNSPFMADKLSEIRKSISEPFAYAFSKNETWLFSLFKQPDSIPLYSYPIRAKDLT